MTTFNLSDAAKFEIVRLTHLADDCADIANGDAFKAPAGNLHKVIDDYVAAQKRLGVQICSEHYVNHLRKQADAITAQRKATYRRVFGPKTAA
jgi:hypothetical protein